ncbi:MAG TPA: fibronectin type III domain-containing protein [Gemmataceae bacterium]|nr:fibronectin type III domain-containing protein [Gemmataceae bacterium]
MYAQPLYVENVPITTGASQGTHNVVFIATEHDSLYAIDANTGTILWHDALLTAEHAGTVTSVPSSAVNSSDISPEIGITATPVIDPISGTIFVENKTQEVAGNSTHFEHHLYAINIGSGAISKQVLIADSIGDTVVSGPAVAGNGAGSSAGVLKFDALRQMERPGLTLLNSNIYLAYASHGDNSPYHGWVLGYSASTLAATAVFNANPNGSDDGIWQSGGSLAYETVNGNTYLYFETGNGSFDTTLTTSPFNSSLMIPNHGDYGDSFVKVAVDGSTAAAGSLNAANNSNGWGMHVADYFTPLNEGNLSGGDTDLGSGAPLLLPASAGSAAHPSLMVGAGKEGRIYLIDRTNMGAYHGDAAGDGKSGTDNVVQETAPGAVNGSLDTPTFFNGVLYYVGGYGDQARTFTVANGVMSSTSVTQSADSYGFPGSTATISTDPGGGNAIVWDIAGPGTNQLRAYNASKGYSSEIYTSAQAANSRDALGSAVKFTAPTVADGEVFVGTSNSVVAYYLIQQATAPPAAPSKLSASAFSGSVINLTWTDNDAPPNSATGYNIFQSPDGKNFTQVGTAGAGATSFAVGSLQVSTTYYFQIDAFNAKGASAFSNVASATTTSQPGVIDFSSGFAGSNGVLTYNGAAKINGTSAELTDGGGGEAGSVFSTNAVDVTRFSNQFTFQLTNANADGFTFTIQGNGPTALGASGGGLGYAGIAKSVAVKFDLYNNAGEGADSTGEYTNGASPTVPAIDLSATGINLHSGDVFQVVMGYDGTTLDVTITDTSTKVSVSQAYTVNIPQVIGSDTGYVGFTGGTGGATAVQNILTWVYSPTATTAPAAPSNLTGTVVSGSEIDISWTNNATNATGILIDRSSDGVNFTQIASVSATVSTYHDTSLSPGNTYYYEVQATNAAGNSPFSNVFQASTLTPPSPPTNLMATNITTTEVDLSWTNVATNATGIKILKQLGNNSSQVVATGLPPTTTSYNITGLVPGSPYTFEVDALNSNGPSGAATIAADTLPAQVTGVTASGGPSEITISWAADPGAVTYNVYRATTAGGEGTTPTWSGITGTSYVDATPTPGTTYYYVVSAVDAKSASPTDPAGESARSAEASALASTLILDISAGGPAAAPFVADTDFSGGAVSGGTTATINTSGLANPPPQSVLQHGRTGNFTYTIPNLLAGISYTVRLDFVEYVFNAAGARVFNVAINGTQVLSNFDIWAAAGGQNIALAKSLTATASSAGAITIGFTSVVNNSIISGIEISYTSTATTLLVAAFPSPVTAGTAGTFTVTAKDAYGNTTTAYTGTVHFTSSDGQAALPADYTFVTADAGVHTFSATLKTAANQSLTATDTVTGTITGAQTGISVTPAAASSLTVSGFPSPITAGVSGTFTVTAHDPYGNTSSGYTGTIHFMSSDSQLTSGDLPADYTFAAADQGVKAFTAILRTPGTQSITAADIGAASITGTQLAILVNAPPLPQIIDNGTSGYSETGAWTTETVPSYGGNERYATSSGTGQNTSTWQVTGLPAGFYQAQVSWHTYPNQAANAPYAIYDGNTLLQTVTVNQTMTASGAMFGGVPFQTLGTFRISSGTLKVVLSNTGGGTYIVADALREAFVPVSGTDLNWSATGDGITGPASVNVQSNFTINRTYTVSGAGAPGSFTINYYASTSSDPKQDLSKATLLGTETLTAAADLAAGNHGGASPAFQLASGGSYYLLATLSSGSFVESDGANDTNDLAVTAQAVQVLGPIIVDNGTAGYCETGAWTTEAVLSYGGTERYATSGGTGQNTATWQASGLAMGLYQVQATWHPYNNEATNAPYAIYDGSTLLQTVAVNQTQTAKGNSFGGVPFQTVATVNITSGTLKVVLNNTGNGTYVVADAVRFVPIPVSNTDLSWSAGGDGVSGPASVNQQTGFTISRTYTVSGAAAPSSFTIAYYASMSSNPNQDLSKANFLGKETISAAADLAVGNHTGSSPTFQFQNGGGYYLFAVLNADNSFTESDFASENNDLAESSQQTVVSGPVIVDNGDPTYSETGTWTTQADKGAYGGSDRYAAASGTGSTTATWVITGLAPGAHAIEASWGPYYNQSTNAPYMIYDGSTLVQVVTADQTKTPSGASAGGVPFQILTHVTLTSGTLKVVLSNSGNNVYVIADALRVE